MNSNGLTLGDLCEAIVDCEHKTAPLEESGIPSIRTSDIRGGVIDFRGANKVSESTYKEWTKRREPREGDLIFCREAPVGEVGRLRVGEQAALGQRTVLLCPDRDKVDPRYLHYLLLGHELQFLMDGWSTGSTVAHLNVKDIRKLPIPSLHKSGDQEFIGGLFDRIDVLRRELSNISRLLEEALSAIFRSWFIDFDPVKAKAEGKLPHGMDEETAALFPDSFEESEFGSIPTGWNLGKLGDCISVVGGGTPSTKNEEFWDGEYNWTSPKDLSHSNSIIMLDTERTITEAGLAKVSSGLLPENSVLMSSRAPIGYLALTKIPVAINQGYIAIPPKNSMSPNFMLSWIHFNMHLIEAYSSGSTFPEISKKEFKKLPILTPPAELIEKFNEKTSRLYDSMETSLKQMNSLISTRDALLPRLMSGELEIN